jgi:hypothetical protein
LPSLDYEVRCNEKGTIGKHEKESDGALLILGEEQIACRSHGIDHGIKKQPGRADR